MIVYHAQESFQIPNFHVLEISAGGQEVSLNKQTNSFSEEQLTVL